jgi:hypothetical protein
MGVTATGIALEDDDDDDDDDVVVGVAVVAACPHEEQNFASLTKD